MLSRSSILLAILFLLSSLPVLQTAASEAEYVQASSSAASVVDAKSAQNLAEAYLQTLVYKARMPGVFADSPGVIVLTVMAGSRAEEVGIRAGDVWLRYRDQPIASMASFLVSRKDPVSGGELIFLRNSQVLSVALPPGQLGAGLGDLVPLGISKEDTELFFKFLAAGYTADRERLMDLIRQNRPVFEQICKKFEQGSTGDQPGAAQLAKWSQDIARFIDLDDQQRYWEDQTRMLGAKRTDLERQLRVIREGQQVLKTQTLTQLMNEGEQAFSAGEMDRAREAWSQGRELASELDLPVYEAVFTGSLARVFRSAGNAQRTLALTDETYDLAAALDLSATDDDAMLKQLHEMLITIGDIQLEVEEAARAYDAFVLAQEFAHHLNRPFDVLLALQRQSNAQIATGNPIKAVQVAQAGVELADALPVSDDPAFRATTEGTALLNQANVLQQLAMAYSAASEQEKAIATVQRALEHTDKLLALSFTDADPQAKGYERQLKRMAEETEQVARRQLAVLYELKGDHRQALTQYRTILEHAASTDAPLAKLEALTEIGKTHEVIGEPLEAIPPLEEALALAKELNDNASLHRVELSLAGVYLRLGDYQRSIEHGKQALQSAKRFPHRIDDDRIVPASRVAWYAERETMALNTLGLAHLLGLNDQKAAKNYFSQALEVAAQFLSDTGREASALQSMAMIHALAGDTEEALKLVKHTLKLYRQGRSRELKSELIEREIEATLLTTLAEICISGGPDWFIQADNYLKAASKIMPSAEDDPWGKVSLREARARLQYFQGDLAAAERNLRENIAEIDAARRRLAANELAQVSFADFYSSNTELLLRVLIGQDKKEAALVLAEKERGRTLAAQFAGRADAALAPAGPSAAQIKDIAAAHDATLVIYAILYDPKAHLLPSRIGGHQSRFESELLIWVVTPGGRIRQQRVDLVQLRETTGSSLAEIVIGIRDALPDEARGRGVIMHKLQTLTQAERFKFLHEVLVDSIADLLPPEGEHLVFVPHGNLLFTPFAALTNDAGVYLVERYPIAMVPAAKLLDLTRNLVTDRIGEVRLDGSDPLFLVVGNPDLALSVKKRYALGPLPYAEQEAKRIAYLLGAPDPLLGDRATKQTVIEQLPDARIIHFATHGMLDDNLIGGTPGAIVLAPHGSDEGLLTAGEILDLDLSADLAVLSACDTGRGRLTGEGVIGLSYALIHAGVPSVVASLWSVPDDSTANLMSHFYRELQHSESKAQALRSAMLSTIKNDDKQPWRWAGFLLIGQW